ncbi:SAM-dependent methyltransferase [Pseudomonas sp. HR96]|uniref:class I SAM-dependent methyltransferase n=1 Tax=Pseudomonas sp. HR96 TaxID=1027966 RepID=UPI002A74F24D|nr:SAM-dependent methyltransferase [Pseudomonas sp. HR96]WPO97994.1 SAM-dependent methyltransferase [Pseudomonas sp. HR96]
MSVEDTYFDSLFKGNDDPWAMRDRWYEQRKRALLMACLPRRQYRSVFEPGCANGETSAELAGRCAALLCSDTAAAAVALTRQRLQGQPHVRVEHGRQPQQWPAGTFDLIVLNELCYYLDSAALDELIERALASLSADGQLLACHWRAPIEGCELDAEQVHRRLRHKLPMTHLLQHEEPDFLLDLFSRDPLSVAQHEGLA